MTFDPFGDFETRGYLRNIARAKDPRIIQQLEHSSCLDSSSHFLRKLLRCLALREKRKFLKRINLICPVQSPSSKIFPFPLYPNQIYIVSRPVPQRGVGHRH